MDQHNEGLPVTGGCALLCMVADGRKAVARKAKWGR